jgi:hypothetical protein
MLVLKMPVAEKKFTPLEEGSDRLSFFCPSIKSMGNPILIQISFL